METEVHKKMKKWIESRNGWGKRCDEFDATCSSCKAWLCFDYLTQVYADKSVDFDIKNLCLSHWGALPNWEKLKKEQKRIQKS